MAGIEKGSGESSKNQFADVVDIQLSEPSPRLQQEKSRLDNDRFRQDTQYRRLFSNWIIYYISSYTICVIVLLFFIGFGLMHVEVPVLIALLGTTMANILGLAYIILHGLFDKDK